MTAPDYTELRERLDYTHAHGIFDAQIAGMLASPAEASAAIAELQAQVEAMREALAPFAAMGRVMERRASMTFGRHPKDSEIVCESSGEVGMGILTMGHFRDAAFLIPDAPGWGGQYRPIKARAALQPKDQSND